MDGLTRGEFNRCFILGYSLSLSIALSVQVVVLDSSVVSPFVFENNQLASAKS